MVREYYEKICAGEQVRTNLIALRDSLKEERTRREFAYLLGGDFETLTELLKNDDPKVRKNAALILGKMESEDLLPILFDAYQSEETRFIRADYLKAISGMDYRPLLGALKERLDTLRNTEAGEQEQKHVSGEMRVLQDMILKYQKTEPHTFTGRKTVSDMILVTNRCQREATARQVRLGRAMRKGGSHRIVMLSGGLRLCGFCADDILSIRTWSELLYPVPVPALPADDPEEIGRLLAGDVLKKAEELHSGEAAFRFRIELKGRVDQRKKGTLIRRIAQSLECQSNGRLVNSVTDYEMEIRLLERRDGTYFPVLKFFTIPDRRFSYRKEVVAASVNPVNAALAAQLARPYLKEGAAVLDPFCGVGTMLIERNYAVRAGNMYGVDLFGEAIEKAGVNTKMAGCSIYYINKDFFEFEHKYLFDEIFTDMPQVTAAKSSREIELLYFEFFEKARLMLKEDAVIILYASEPQFVVSNVRRYSDLWIAEKFVFNEKTGTSLFVIQRGEGAAQKKEAV
ncbi:MAG TPA: HEAT repeat domain-containing protein [Candidatus Choladousia intestinipullorum]|nr:HEAT repeat domain-containing protein [Candidatus Choladousia intestinipullorum]